MIARKPFFLSGRESNVQLKNSSIVPDNFYVQINRKDEKIYVSKARFILINQLNYWNSGSH